MSERLYDGEVFDHKGYRFRVQFHYDPDMREPWVEMDGHGVISEWTNRAKRPGEVILVADHYGRSYRYYDVEETMKIAIRDQWGTQGDEGLTKRQKAAKAVQADFDYCRGWANDEWHWVTIEVHQVDDDEQKVGDSEYLGGCEGLDQDYLSEEARNLADEIHRRLEVEQPGIVVSEN